MKIRTSQLRILILYLMVVYVLNKSLFDWITGDKAKFLYYMIVAFGTIFSFLTIGVKRKARMIYVSFVLYAIVIVLNAMLYYDSERFNVGIIEYITYPLSFFAILYFMKGKTDYSRFFHFLCYWGAVTSILGFIEYLTKSSILPDYEGRIYTYANGSSSYRATVFVGSPMMLAVLLGVMLIISFYFYHEEKKNKYLFMIVLDVLGLFATGSRGPLVLSFIGVLIMYYYFYKKRMLSSKTVYWILFFGFVVLFGMLIIMVFPNIKTGNETLDFFIYRLSSTFDFSGEWGNAERLVRWGYYIGQFLKKPFTGYGLATTSAAIQSNVAVTAHGVTTESGVLARLVETGLAGAMMYYFFVGQTLKFGLKNIKGRIASDSTLVFVAGIVGLILLEDIILQISLDIFCTFIFWFAIAYAVNRQLNISKTISAN